MAILAPETKRSAVLAGMPTAVADWEMDEASSNLTDEIGSKVMTANGTPAYEDGPLQRGDQGGESIRFDGSTDYFATPDHADFNFGSAFSVSIVFNLDTIGGTLITLASQYSSGTGAWQIYAQSGQVVAGLSLNGTLQISVASGAVLSAGVDYHLVVTHDGSTIRMYLDGLLIDTIAMAGAMFNSTDDLEIGSVNGGSNKFLGALSRLILWNVVLTPQEIARFARVGVAFQSDEYDDVVALYNAVAGSPSLALKMDDPTVTLDDTGSFSVTFSGATQVTYSSILSSGKLASKFDGVDDKISYGSINSIIGGDWYVRGWIQSVSPESVLLFDCRDLANFTGFLLFLGSGGGDDARILVGNGSLYTNVEVESLADFNEPHFIEGWYDSAAETATVRIDGSASFTAAIPSGFAIPAGSVVPFTGASQGGGFNTGEFSDLSIYPRLPFAGEGEAVYTAGRKLIENFDSTVANNPDLTTTAAYWALHTPIPTADNFMIHLSVDEALTSATQLDLSPVASVSTAGWESAVRYPAYIQGGNAVTIEMTGGIDHPSHGLRSQIDHFRVLGIPINFPGNGGQSSSGKVVVLDGNDTIIDSCPITFTGDITGSETTPSDFIGGAGTGCILRNCLVEFNGDYAHATDSDAVVGIALEQSVVTRFGAGASDLQLGATVLTNCAVFGLASDAGSIWKNATKSTGHSIGDNFGDAAGGDYSALSTGDVYQTGTLIDGVLTDSQGTTWTVTATPNASHLDTLFVAPPISSGVDFERGRFISNPDRRPGSLLERIA